MNDDCDGFAFIHQNSLQNFENDEPVVKPSPTFDSLRREDGNGEFWSGRDLQSSMDYSQWCDFALVIEKAKASLALIQGADQAEHHLRTSTSDGGRWAKESLTTV